MKTIATMAAIAILICSTGRSAAQILNQGNMLQKNVNNDTDTAIERVVFPLAQNAQPDLRIAAAKPPALDEIMPPDNCDPNLQGYSNFDFVPGERVVFFDDFAQDNIGDFPAAWNTNGSAEVVRNSLYAGKWMKLSSRKAVWTDALLHLPEEYTIEFDIIPIAGEEHRMAGYKFRIIESSGAKTYDAGSLPGKAGLLFSCAENGSPVYRSYGHYKDANQAAASSYSSDRTHFQKLNIRYHISIAVEKNRVRIYQDQNKLFDLPMALPAEFIQMNRLRFEEGAALISNVRIAVDCADMPAKLVKEGKLVSYGIYFDAGKDLVKPESYATLKKIANVLQEHPEINLAIVGHTDTDGSDALNLDLSRRRANNVRNELIHVFGIDMSRLQSDGKGECQPVAANNNNCDKALNRRIEFIKL